MSRVISGQHLGTNIKLLVEQYNDRIQTVKKFLKDNENLTVEQKEKLNRLVISLERKLVIVAMSYLLCSCDFTKRYTSSCCDKVKFDKVN